MGMDAEKRKRRKLKRINRSDQRDHAAGFWEAGFTLMSKLWTLSHNNAAPVLRLHDHHLEDRDGFRTSALGTLSLVCHSAILPERSMAMSVL